MSHPVDLSIVIVAYRAAGYLERCLITLCAALAQSSRTAEILVVDNHSGDGTDEVARTACPTARVLALPANVGFAAANNIGSLHARGRHLVLLNPDTEVPAGAIDRLVDALEHDAGIGIAAPRLDNPDGSLQVSCYRFPTLPRAVLDGTPLPWIRRFGRFGAQRFCDPSHTAPRDVEWASGACLVISRALFESLDGFDERFFMYYEDVDLCRRVHEMGGRVRYVPDARILHHGNRSEGTLSAAVVERAARGALQYHRSARPRVPVTCLVAALTLGAWCGAVTTALAARVRPELAARARAKRQWQRELARAVARIADTAGRPRATAGFLRVKHWLSRQSAVARFCDLVVRGAAAVGIAALERVASWRPLPDLDRVRPSIRDVVVPSFFGIGDALMDQPAMAALRRAWPGARIRLICSHTHADLLAGQGLADQIIAVDESQFLEAARRLRDDRPDLFVMFHSNLEYYAFGRLCGARLRAGYLWDFRAARASGFRAAPRPNRSRSRVVRGLEVAALLGADVAPGLQPRWHPSDADRAAANTVLNRAGVDAGTRFVVVNPNKTAAWLGAGRWPPQRWRHAIARLRREHGVTVVLVGSPAERADVLPIAAAFYGDPGVVTLAGETSLRETGAVLARAELVVTTDSGIMHLAGAVGVRTVSLFTFSDPESFATGAQNQVLQADVPCSPCVRNHMSARDHHPPLCPYDYRCGRAIATDDVTNAIARVVPAHAAADVAS